MPCNIRKKVIRPPNNSVLLKINFSQPKHMLWVLKRTVSWRRFLEHPKHMFKLMVKKIITFYIKKVPLTGTMVLSKFHF